MSNRVGIFWKDHWFGFSYVSNFGELVVEIWAMMDYLYAVKICHLNYPFKNIAPLKKMWLAVNIIGQ